MAHEARSLMREKVRVGKHFQLSLCELTVAEWLSKHLDNSTTKSENAAAKDFSKMCLLYQLQAVKYLSVNEAYEEYLGMLPKSLHPTDPVRSSSVKSFVDSILSKNNGLPVLIMNIEDKRYIMLFEGKHIRENEHLELIDRILTEAEQSESSAAHLSEHIRSVIQLLCSPREYALVVFILSLMFSATTIRQYFNISEDNVVRLKRLCSQFTEDFTKMEKVTKDESKDYFDNTLLELGQRIQKKGTDTENRKIEDEIERESRKEDLENMNERLAKMKSREKFMIQQIAARRMRVWKKGLRCKVGIRRKFTIDRGAETAVFNTLQEQLLAHCRRKGTPTVERRLQKKELRFIANKYLKENGKNLIKSYETVRSWSVPKRKSSIQSKQHRGQNLFKHRKPQKKYVEEHINLHYNRAHIKNYTRFLFSTATKENYRKFSVRRCIDDKAYLRCGTSEGFARPANIPICIAGKEINVPSYDFPEKIGYVSPGVNLIIKDMKEVPSPTGERSTFAMNDARISVNCKPKMFYASSATNWANDMYADRIEFPEEHELPNKLNELEYPRTVIDSLVFTRDSLRQFNVMTIDKDFLKCCEHLPGHVDRERMRLSVIITRMLHTYKCISSFSEHLELLPSAEENLLKAIEKAQYLDTYLSEHIEPEVLTEYYQSLCQFFEEFINDLSQLVPLHRPIDIQTSDAGPGVGTSEKMVRLRLVESFLIHDLDFQCRMHYAPRDSKCHKVEQVMSYLTDAAGDGRHIIPDEIRLLQDLSNDEVINMSVEEQLQYKQKQSKKIAFDCAKKVSARYQGKPAMKTTIFSKVPKLENPYQHFFFDESYLKKCINTSKKNIGDCPGYSYFEFLSEKFDEMFIVYDNGVEGIRNDGRFRCPHTVQRIPPPVPDLSTVNDEGVWHYYTPETIPSDMKNTENREINDFNPRKQLHKLIESCGNIDLYNVETVDGSVQLRDRNKTWQKINDDLPKFIKEYTGEDLKIVVEKEAEKIYLRQLQKFQKMISKEKKGPATEDDYKSIMKDNFRMKIKKTVKMPTPVPWNGRFGNVEFTNTCTADNMLYYFHFKLSTCAKFIKEVDNSNIQCLKILNEVHRCFQNKQFAEGKYLWFKHVNKDLEQDSGTWNCYGSEDEYFFRELSQLTTTAYTNTCTNTSGKCTAPYQLHQARIVSFRYPAAGAMDLQQGVSMWFENSEMTICTKMKEGTRDKCYSERSSSKREFICGTPLIVPLEVNDCPWTIMPDTLKIAGVSYTLGAVTMGNGGHFVSNVKSVNDWYKYDGLKEYHQPGTGLKKIANGKVVPPGYRRNYAVYSRF